MKTPLATHSQFLCAPWRQRKTEKSFGTLYVLAAFSLLMGWAIGWVGFLKDNNNAWLVLGYATSGVFTVVLLCLLQILSFMHLNHPHHARTVPGHLRRLRETVIAVWLVSAAVCALIWGLAFGNIATWFLVFAVLIVVFVAPFLWPVRWVVAFIPVAWLMKSQAPVAMVVREGLSGVWQDWPLPIATLTLLICARILTHAMIRDGNAKHATAFARYRILMTAATPGADGRQLSLHHWGNIGSTILRVGQFPLDHYMQFLLRKPLATEASVLARAELVFGRDAHWIWMVCAALLILLGAGVLGLAETMFMRSLPDVVPAFDFVLGMGMTFTMMIMTAAWPSAIYMSRKEQKLLVLLPGMPRGASLNRLLARRMLWQLLPGWLFVAAVTSQLHLLSDSHLLTSIGAGLMPAVPFLIRDWSRMKLGARDGLALTQLSIFIGPVVCGAVQYWLHWSSATVYAVSIVLTSILLYWRWRRLGSFPVAFPAGRLAA